MEWVSEQRSYVVNQWGRDGNFSSGSSSSAGSIIIPAIIALVIGAGGGYVGARFLNSAASDIEARDKKITELQQALSEMKFDTQSTDTQQSVLRQRVKDLEAQVETLNRTKESLKKYADEQASKVSGDAQAEIAALQKTIEEAGDLSKELNRARKSLKVSELQIIELEGTVKDQKTEIGRLEKALQQSDGKGVAAVAALTKAKADLEASLQQAKTQLATLPTLKAEIADLKAQLAERADSADAEARRQIQALEKQKAALESQLEEARRSAGDTNAQADKIADLQKQLDEITETLAERDDAARKAEENLKAAQAALKTSEKEADSLRDENTTLTEAREELEKQVASLKAAVDAAKSPTTPTDDQPVANDNNGLTPRDRGDVEDAVEDLPGYGNLSRDKQETLMGMLERGECVTDSLKAAYGHVSPVSVRNLFRKLGGRC
jgi:DNA repair exonuclease SbcCD ATPase subunit